MFTFNSNFCNKIAQISLNHFDKLPKTGKPTLEEWTILASITQYDSVSDDLVLVAMGTGTKCIGVKKMSPNGDILNDSHAEIICRRAFLRYLYEQIKCAFENKPSVFALNKNNKLDLQDSLSFHFFTTHMPCGDAAIFPKQNFEIEEFGQCLSDSLTNEEKQNQFENKKRSLDVEDGLPGKKLKISEEDVFRTGAKCLPDDVRQDLKSIGIQYHTVGAIRTKPGRGDPTLSVSCSDKIAKWTFVGIQGSLISYFQEHPIYLSSIIVCGGTPFNEESFLRSIQNRFHFNNKLSKPYCHKIPLIKQADIEFKFCKTDSKRPCPSSIIWSKVSLRTLEVSVDGRKQGVTKKNLNKREGRLLICKKELFVTFIDIVKSSEILKLNTLKSLSYGQVKNSTRYKKIWEFVKENIFETWSNKDSKLLLFYAD